MNVAMHPQKPDTYKECKDIDEVTCKEEICTGLEEKFKLGKKSETNGRK